MCWKVIRFDAHTDSDLLTWVYGQASTFHLWFPSTIGLDWISKLIFEVVKAKLFVTKCDLCWGSMQLDWYRLSFPWYWSSKWGVIHVYENTPIRRLQYFRADIFLLKKTQTFANKKRFHLYDFRIQC